MVAVREPGVSICIESAKIRECYLCSDVGPSGVGQGRVPEIVVCIDVPKNDGSVGVIVENVLEVWFVVGAG